MKKTLLTAVSVIAFLGAGQAAAEMSKEDAAKVQRDNAVVTEAELEQGWEDTKDAVSNAADNVTEATENAYMSIKNALSFDDKKATAENIKMRATANGMLGEPIFNENGERVAKIQDVILNRDGAAIMLILADGDFTGLGKLVAYDYSILTKATPDGDMIASLTEDMIDDAASFSYDRSKYSDTVRVIPSNGFSVASLLDGNLTNPKGQELATVDNIVLRGGEAESLVVGFGDTLGLGGEQALVAFDDTDVISYKGNVNFQLSENEAEQFKSFKQKIMNEG